MRLPWDKLQTGLLRDGFLGIGGSSQQTDRANELSGLQSQWNIFGQGVNLMDQTNATGQQLQGQGQTNLNNASQYWNNLLTAGRTQTAQQSAPAVNAALAQSNAATTQGAQFGSGRSGGTAAQNAERQTQTQGSIDNIINSNLVGGKAAAAQWLQGIGETQLSAGGQSINQALSALGISGDAGENVATDAQSTYAASKANSQELGGAISSILDFAFL